MAQKTPYWCITLPIVIASRLFIKSRDKCLNKHSYKMLKILPQHQSLTLSPPVPPAGPEVLSLSKTKWANRERGSIN